MNGKPPSPESRWRIDPGVRFRKVLDEAVLVKQEEAEVMVLSETAHAFLECCRKNLRFGDLVDRILEEYEVERDVLVADLVELIADLESRGVIHPVS